MRCSAAGSRASRLRLLALAIGLTACTNPADPELPRTHLPTPVGGNLLFGSLTASTVHTCGLTTDRDTYCWGGLGEQDPLLPTLVADPARFVQVSAHCGLRDTGEVRCWDHPTLQPVPVPGAPRLTMIGSGPVLSCGLTAEGSVRCWNHQELAAPRLTADLPPLTTLEVGRSAFTVCGLAADGTGHCTALDGRGEAVGGGRTFSVLSNGGFHACGVASGNVFCWGRNEWGQLGTGTTGYLPAPERVLGEQPFVSISAGAEHTCALTAAGAAWCWGLNNLGQLGSLGTETCTTQIAWVGTVTEPCARRPRAVETDLRFVSLASGHVHTCGLTATGTAYCWGARALLGDGRRR